MVGWLVGWWVGGLVGWWVHSFKFHSFIHSFDCLFVCLFVWFIGSLVHWFVVFVDSLPPPPPPNKKKKKKYQMCTASFDLQKFGLQDDRMNQIAPSFLPYILYGTDPYCQHTPGTISLPISKCWQSCSKMQKKQESYGCFIFFTYIVYIVYIYVLASPPLGSASHCMKLSMLVVDVFSLQLIEDHGSTTWSLVHFHLFTRGQCCH